MMTMRYIFIFIGFFCFQSLQAQTEVVQIRALGKEGVLLPENWKYLSENLDNPAPIDPNFEDAHLPTINPQLWLDSLNQTIFKTGGWFRLHFEIGKSLQNKALALKIDQRGASEIYLDGKLIYQYGKVSDRSDVEQKYSSRWLPLPIVLDNTRNTHVLAIKYSNANAWKLRQIVGRYARTAGFKLMLAPATESIKDYATSTRMQVTWNISLFCVLATIGVLHFFIFFFDRRKQADLFYALFSLSMGSQFLFNFLLLREHHPEVIIGLNIMNFVISHFQVILLLRFVYQLFDYPKPTYFRAYFGLYFVGVSVFFINHPWINYLQIFYFSLFMFLTFRVIWKAVKDQKDGAKLIGIGILTTYIFMFVISERNFGFINLWVYLPETLAVIINYLGILSTVMAVSVYLARNIARTNAQLQNQLQNVKELSAKNIEQAQQNRQILENQNNKLERLVQERTSEIQEKNAELSQQNEEIATQRDSIERSKAHLNQAFTHITDSVRYAQRIQRAVLGSREEIIKQFPEGFIFFRPKDIVSGDFYWYQEVETLAVKQGGMDENTEFITHKRKQQILVIGDCTGHGVPGAFMTVMGANFLDEIVNSRKITDASKILQELDKKVIHATHRNQTENEVNPNKDAITVNDGMDITIFVYEAHDQKAHVAGAKNPVYLVRNNEIYQFFTSRYAIGGERCADQKKFEKQVIDIQPNDMIYIATDGFQDQFGGKHDKKFMKKRFRELLLKISDLPIKKQKLTLQHELQAWQGRKAQTDDILIAGIRL